MAETGEPTGVPGVIGFPRGPTPLGKRLTFSGSDGGSSVSDDSDGWLCSLHKPFASRFKFTSSCSSMVMTTVLKSLTWMLTIVTLPFSAIWCLKICNEHERLVVLRLGRLISDRPKGPGMCWILPCIDEFTRVDLRTVSMDVPPQEVLTKDSVTVSVDAVVYYKVSNPISAITAIEDYSGSTRLLAQTTLRNMLGMRTLADILQQRTEIVRMMQEILDEATDPWGIKVERVEMKDARIPYNLQRALAAEAEAARHAKAKVIAAEGEFRSSRALREAATVIASQPGALHLRYLQTLSMVGGNENQTIVLPLPTDLIHLWASLKQQELKLLKLQIELQQQQLASTLSSTPTIVVDGGPISNYTSASKASS